MPRPRAVTRSDDALLTNFELARVFREIGDMLEIIGEVVYKAVAYRRVADAIERYPEDVASLYRRGTPPKLPGVGPALAPKLTELSTTGSLEYHERLHAQVPDGLLRGPEDHRRRAAHGAAAPRRAGDRLASTRCAPRRLTDRSAASRASRRGRSRTSSAASRRLDQKVDQRSCSTRPTG